ncbi:MAG: 1-acyl-sn-glycerol-3-phosphate acyltransferase [candidate division KSB1 bacterium]|nr:1-acyl-sn-glycerol-3-phosphate acyltransferase [candidate division KSB1 bacterium]MDZ7366737.1 1-acyl-sn-glycerol-3-phosphate acyltransferase [candidate division KSB1 bacterium]
MFRMGFFLLFRIQVQGREHIPRHGKLLLAANHVSAYDPFVIGALVPRGLYFLAKKELFQNPVVGVILRVVLHAVPVDRRDIGHTTVRHINHLLENGEAILLFPEGTRSRSGQIGAGKSGVGMIAAANQADILPVRVEGLFGKRASLWRRPRIKVIFGSIISVAPFLKNGTATKEIYRQIASTVVDRIRVMGTALAA